MIYISRLLRRPCLKWLRRSEPFNVFHTGSVIARLLRQLQIRIPRERTSGHRKARLIKIASFDPSRGFLRSVFQVYMNKSIQDTKMIPTRQYRPIVNGVGERFSLVPASICVASRFVETWLDVVCSKEYVAYTELYPIPPQFSKRFPEHDTSQ
jgi:hypothetical protein